MSARTDRPPDVKRAARVAPETARETAPFLSHDREAAMSAAPERSAENWFLDAATYAGDGDLDEAIAAAKRGIEAAETLKRTRDEEARS
jgi:hypothetical protein